MTRERLQRQALEGLHRLAITYQERGEYERALPHAWRQLELDPWREDAHRQVMRLLALSGQQATAIAQYESCRDLLKAELNTEPSERTQALYEMLRSGEWPPETPVPDRQIRSVGPCPYRGLATFQEQDAAFFFGRGRFTRGLRRAVREQPMVAVVGSSGSGKSSVVLAGLLPRLREEEDWQVAVVRPGGQPFYTLAAALLPFLEPDVSEADRLIEAQKLAAALRDGSLELR